MTISVQNLINKSWLAMRLTTKNDSPVPDPISHYHTVSEKINLD